MLARLKRLLGVNGSSHGGETSFCPMSQDEAAETMLSSVMVVRLRDGSLRTYVPLSDTIELKVCAERLWLSCYLIEEQPRIVGSPAPKQPA
jgi:hypothetical protein